MDRILIWMENKNNQQLIGNLLEKHYDVLFEDDLKKVDMIILDGYVLDEHWDQLKSRKTQEEPLFIPFLLVTPINDLGMITRHMWRIIDEIINIPINKMELQARVENLLKSRRLSLFTYNELNQIFNNTVEGIIVLDGDFNLLFANQPFIDLLDIEKDLIGNNCHDILPDKICNTLYRPFKQIFDEEENIVEEVLDIGNCTKKSYLITNTPFRDMDGNIVGIIASFKDITLIKEFQDQLMHLNSVLMSIRQINELIVRETQKDILLKKAVNILVETRNINYAGIAFRQSDDKMKIYSSSGHDKDFISDYFNSSKLDNNPLFNKLKKYKPVLIHLEKEKDSDFLEKLWILGYKSILILPLTALDEFHGVLIVFSKERNIFDHEEIELSWN